MEEIIKCQCCNKRKAVRYDYRTFNDTTGKYRSCEDCFTLTDREWQIVRGDK